MNINQDLLNLEFLMSLPNQKIGAEGHQMTLREHVKTCENGCSDCAFLRYFLEKSNDVNISRDDVDSGISKAQQVDYQTIMPISAYFPRGDEFRNFGVPDDAPYKEKWNKWVYIFLKVQEGNDKSSGFKDTEIREYFLPGTGCNTGEWQGFKREAFPDWEHNKNEILQTLGPEAELWYLRTYGPKPRINVRRHRDTFDL